MPCSAFLFFGRVIGTPQLAPFLTKTDLGNTPLKIGAFFLPLLWYVVAKAEGKACR
jgi:hypothetical protein